MSGSEEYKKTAEKIKAEVEASKEKEQSALATMDEETMAFFKANADVGTENLGGGSIPQLKVTEPNSTKNLLPSGEQAPIGEFYYQPLQCSYGTELFAAILTISKGFYAMDNSENPKRKWNQLVGGIMLNSMQPFVIFITGTKCQYLWDFAKEIRPYTKNRKQPVPMFAIQTTLKTEKIKTNYGFNHIVHFNIEKMENGTGIKIITDMNMLQELRSYVEPLEDMIASFIQNKEVDEDGNEIHQQAETIHAKESEPNGEATAEEAEAALANPPAGQKDVSDDIPF